MAYTNSDTQRIFKRPYRSISRPVIGEKTAIINAGMVSTNLTSNAAFSTSLNAAAICGKAGEMVMTDMIVKLLTSNSVSFSFQFLFSMLYYLTAFIGMSDRIALSNPIAINPSGTLPITSSSYRQVVVAAD